MTEHTFEYPADFEPEKHCSQWAMTDRTCCPNGSHQRGCEIIQGYHKARNSHAPKHPDWIDFTSLAIVGTMVAYYVLKGILA